jgi:hypothetical protein
MDRVLELTPAVLSVVAVVIGLGSYFAAFRALRAKSRLQKRLHEKILVDATTRRVANAARQRRRLSTEEEAKAREIIEEIGASLSEKDRKLLNFGLHQRNKDGEQRYIADIMSESISS